MATAHPPIKGRIAVGASIIVTTGAAGWIYSTMSGKGDARSYAEQADYQLTLLDDGKFSEAVSPVG